MADVDCHACREYRELSRRGFLAATGGSALALSAPAWLPRVVFAQDACTDRDVIVAVFLSGAADCLTLCVPHAEDDYYNARPTLSIPRPDSGSPFAAIDLDGFFGFAQPMAPMIPAFQAGHLAVVHACGSVDTSRSHFDARRLMEIGNPTQPTDFSGWLARHLLSIAPSAPNPILRAVGIGVHGLQRSLQNGVLSLPIQDLDRFGLAGTASTVAARSATISSMYQLGAAALQAAAENTQNTIALLDTIDFANYVPGGGAVYPDSDFGRALKSAAALIKADVGVEAVAVDIGGWDHHIDMGPRDGLLASMMGDLASTLAAFHDDMFALNGKNVTVVVKTEFGRRLQENGSSGADHGHGSVMLVMGNHIAGGQVLTVWPGLGPGDLFEGRDLEITIDYRDILAEIIQNRLNNPNLAAVFPNFVPTIRGVTTACAANGGPSFDGPLHHPRRANAETIQTRSR